MYKISQFSKITGLTVKALRTVHYGSYDTLYLAYQSIFAYVRACFGFIFTSNVSPPNSIPGFSRLQNIS